MQADTRTIPEATTAERLRALCACLRIKPTPLADIIPVLQKAADELDAARSTARAPVDAKPWIELTDEDRDRAFHTLPDMLDGFLKKWGWLHFAKAIEDECLRKNGRWSPTFDAISPKQEALARQFSAEIAGKRGQPGSPPDPVRLLEMAEALYLAEREDAASLQQHEQQEGA